MKYICIHPDCGKIFTHPTKQTKYGFNNKSTEEPKDFMHPGDYTVTSQQETYVCPFCGDKNFVEYTEPVEEIANVYIYDLTTGPQTELDGLLAQGYRIQSRYAKQYFLEKPKEAKQP